MQQHIAYTHKQQRDEHCASRATLARARVLTRVLELPPNVGTIGGCGLVGYAQFALDSRLAHLGGLLALVVVAGRVVEPTGLAHCKE